jgi:hypothetical protein
MGLQIDGILAASKGKFNEDRGVEEGTVVASAGGF